MRFRVHPNGVSRRKGRKAAGTAKRLLCAARGKAKVLVGFRVPTDFACLLKLCAEGGFA